MKSYFRPTQEKDYPGPFRRFNRTKDLIPLCPNYRVIVHRSEPPITIAELKTVLAK
jgi:predicted HNH restriction endonuclease